MDARSRRCSRCGLTKPDEEFPLRSGGVRRQSWCRPCKQRYDRQWYQQNRATHVANVAEARRRQRARNMEILAAEKDVPCADCGRRFPPHVMDFDHVRGEKTAPVTQLARRPVTEARLRAEIAKCEVVCANCHRDRTYRRRQWYGGSAAR